MEKEELSIIREVKRQEKLTPEGYAKISSAIDISLDQIQEVLTPARNITAMDLQAFPAALLAKPFLFRKWFQTEFFTLDTPEDFEKFTEYARLAIKSLKTGAMRFDENPDFAKKVEQSIERGFNNLEDVISFFRFVAADQEKDIDEFVVNDLKSTTKGHERYSACRILKRGLAIYAAEPHIKSVLEWAQYTLLEAAQIPGGEEKGGVLSGIYGKEDLKILDLAENRELLGEFYNWLAVAEYVESPIFIVSGKEHSNIKRIEIGFKDNRKGIEKLERSGKVSAKGIDELFRVRIVLNDEGMAKSEQAMELLDLMQDVETSLEEVSTYDVTCESRDKNYLSKKQKKLFFPEKLEKDDEYKGALQRMVLKPLKYNSSSGNEYRAMTQKICYLDKQTGGSQFGFEIQYLTDSAHRNNENEKTSGGHFMMELRNFAKHCARMESVMTREEIIEKCSSFLQNYEQRYIKETPKEFDPTRGMKLPSSLKGDFKKFNPGWESHPDYGKFYKGGVASEKFSMDFGKKVNRAEAVFQFLHAEGHLIRVPKNFPQTLRARNAQLKQSTNYLGANSYTNILKVVEAE